MNYDGAPDLEFGGGNTKVDPSVIRGKYSDDGSMTRTYQR
jgi:hypothetical protein